MLPQHILLDLDRLVVQQQVAGRRHEVVVDASGELLDLFDRRGGHAEREEALVGLAPKLLVLHVGLPCAPRSATETGACEVRLAKTRWALWRACGGAAQAAARTCCWQS